MTTKRRSHIHLAAMFAIASAGATSLAWPAVLVVRADQNAGNLVLTWSPGTAPYKVSRLGKPQPCFVQTFTTSALTYSFPESALNDETFFVITDSSPPISPTITAPVSSVGNTVSAATVDVTGTVSPSGTSVCVNNIPATVNGTSYSAVGIPLTVGTNAIFANALVPNGNLTVSTDLTLVRNSTTQLPIISVTDNGGYSDLTPRITVTYSDPENRLNLSTFRAYLNGTDVTRTLNGSPTFPSPPGNSSSAWQVSPSQALSLGSNQLLVSIADLDGGVASATTTLGTRGPYIMTLYPRSGLPGSVINLYGNNYSITQPNMVTFNGVQPLQVTAVSETQITVTVPPGARDGDVTVQTDGMTSNGLPFDVAFNSVTTFEPWHVVVDASGNTYYSAPDNWIRRLDAVGNAVLFYNVGEEISGLALDPTRTTLYVSSRVPTLVRNVSGDTSRWFYTGNIRKVSVASGTGQIWTTFPASAALQTIYCDATGITTDSAGNVYIMNIEATGDPAVVRQAIRKSPSTSASFTKLHDYAFAPDRLVPDLSVDSAGNVFATWCPSRNACALHKNGSLFYNPPGGFAYTSVVDCRDHIYLTEFNQGHIFDLTQSATVARNIDDSLQGNTEGLDIDVNGNIFVGSTSTSSNIHRALNAGVSERNAACGVDFEIDNLAGSTVLRSDLTPNVQSTKIYADFSPHAGDNFGPGLYIPPGTKATWQCFDPDDPAVDTILDPMVNGRVDNDNCTTYDTKPVFEGVTGYPLSGTSPSICDGSGSVQTLVNVNGHTEITLNGSDCPGDNFFVRVSLTLARPTGNVTRSADSEIVTTWKIVRLETDSMGRNIGPFDTNGNDAFIGDVPPGDTRLLGNALSQAYILLSSSSFDNTNVPFDPHVPDWVFDPVTGAPSSTITSQMNAQGQAGRLSVSAADSWAVYTQGAYESFSDWDYDPDGESMPDSDAIIVLGLTNVPLAGKYSLVFMENLREYSQSPGVNHDEASLRAMTTLHEIGHQIYLEHPDPETLDGSHGVMERSQVFPYFVASDLRKVRRSGVPSNRE